MNQDIQDLPHLLENRIGGAVQYACAYWAGHLRLSPTSEDFAEQIIDLVTNTLQNAPPWIEVMSLENQLGEVIHYMNSLLDWLDEVGGFYLLLKMFTDNTAKRLLLPLSLDMYPSLLLMTIPPPLLWKVTCPPFVNTPPPQT